MHTKLLIIGSGPAAHTAAIYASRALVKPILYEGFMAGGIAPGGQLTTTTDVENFPGFPQGVGGQTLMELMRAQTLRFGTSIITETISRLDLTRRPFKAWVEAQDVVDGPATVTADSLIIATGATAKRMGLEGEKEYWQRGISACAVCDGAAPLFRNKNVAVVGGGDSACEEALFLTRYATKVHLLVRKPFLRASPILQKRLSSNPKVIVHFSTIPVRAQGDGKTLQCLELLSTKTKEMRSLSVAGLFYAIGHAPNTLLVKDSLIDLDTAGYIKTVPGSTRTSVKGVFAAGDVQDHRYRQAVTAAGSGCMAALDAQDFLVSSNDPTAFDD